ncbi:telomere zinc finger-associated protein isoform X1 [Cygnus olor]|uniref:telomere zinc finger-associated protein isoform X1 n=1 Tax=Cygnus olor TaxID=8869 RepID=UPI001ADEA64E|nr:telomere zinc finger-associated protein isoform X1 [Cygnus olor]
MAGAAAAHSVRVLRELNRQRAAGQFCDATLGVGGRQFRAHWPVLASCSRFFRGVGGGGGAGPVPLPEGLADTFQLLLDFFYTGRLALTAHNRARLLAAAEQLGVPDAVALCRAFRPAADRHRPRRAPGAAPRRADGAAAAPPEPGGEAVREGAAGSGAAAGGALTAAVPPQASPAAAAAAAGGGQGRGGGEALPGRKAPRGKKKPPAGAAAAAVPEAGLAGSGKGTAAPAECPTCHKTFLSKYYLKVHNRKHTGEKPFECSKCGKCYFRKENLLEHEARNCMNRSEQVFTCSVCQEVFKRRMELRLHMVSHTGEMPYKCSSCAQQFMQKKDLQSHMIKLHGAPKPHASYVCTRRSSTGERSCLSVRSADTEPQVATACRCTSRPSTGTSAPMFVSSAITPSHRKPTSTCTCARTPVRSPSSATSAARPSGHKCSLRLCLDGDTQWTADLQLSLPLLTAASLDKHNRTHTGERPFSCEFCDQRFTEKGPLLRHIASRHQEGRPHFCQICGKTFKAIEQLRVHVRRHKGVRKFECTECGYKFTRQAHLRRHMEIHDRVENYNPRQRKLRNLIIEDEKAVVVALQPPQELEVGSAEVIVESLSHGSLPEEIPVQRLCSNENFSTADVIEQSLIITTAIPDDCET